MNDITPVATLPHAELYSLLTEQPWSLWAVDSAALEPLVAYQPVALAKLMRVLRSHYTFSDLYVFKHTSTAAEIEMIDWRAVPHIDAQQAAAYIIERAVGKPFLGVTGSLDAAQRGEIVIVFPADK